MVLSGIFNDVNKNYCNINVNIRKYKINYELERN